MPDTEELKMAVMNAVGEYLRACNLMITHVSHPSIEMYANEDDAWVTVRYVKLNADGKPVKGIAIG